MAKNYDFTFFPSKYTHNFQATINPAAMIFIKRQNDSIIIKFTKTAFYPEEKKQKKQIKRLRFSNVLSVCYWKSNKVQIYVKSIWH